MQKVTLPEEPKLDVARADWEDLTQRVKTLLDAVQNAEAKLRQYAKEAPIIDSYIDKVTLQLENMSSNLDSLINPPAENPPSAGLSDLFLVV